MSDEEVQIKILDEDVEVYVSYSSYGENIPASHMEPAESETLEINSISRTINDIEVDVTEMFTDKEMEKITIILQGCLDED